MDMESLDWMLAWVVDYNYHEDTHCGIGYCKATIRIRDFEDDLKSTFDELTREDKKSLACGLIDMAAHPCDGYEEDFDDKKSSFGYQLEWKDGGIAFAATFRV